MQDYKPNSHRFKEEQKNGKSDLPAEKKVEKVVKGTVKTKKKTGLNKLTDVFISEDANSVKSYIFMDVLVPAIKNTILDIITDSANMIFGGNKKHSSGSKVSYRNYYDDKRYGRSRFDEPKTRSRFDYDDLIFENRGEAENVLDQMDAMIERYGVVTVSDMYDMADLTAPYTANRYGWANTRNMEIKRIREGYIIQTPRPMPID